MVRSPSTAVTPDAALLFLGAEGWHKGLLGLIAEKATETLRREPGEFVTSGVTNAGTPYLGPVVTDARGLIQWVEVGKLLPAAKSMAFGGLPLGLAHGPTLLRAVKKGQSLSWADVANDTTSRAYTLRREMERIFTV